VDHPHQELYELEPHRVVPLLKGTTLAGLTVLVWAVKPATYIEWIMMAKYNPTDNILIVGPSPPIKGLANTPDAITFTPEKDLYGYLDITLMQSSSYNTLITVLRKLSGVMPFFPIEWKPPGTLDFLYFPTCMFGYRPVMGIGGRLTVVKDHSSTFPRRYTAGNQIGNNTTRILCCGINDLILGDF